MKTIDENEFGEFIREIATYSSCPETVASEAVKYIERFGSDAAEPEAGAHWEPLPHMDDCQRYYCRCSKCGRIVSRYHGTGIYRDCPYCHCGAKMEEGNSED